MAEIGVSLAMTSEDENVTEETHFVSDDETNNHTDVTAATISQRTVLKNVAVLSAAFLLLFTAFQSLQNLQSSLNKEEGLGTVSLSVIYVFSMLSGLLLPPLVIRRLGCKWTIVACAMCYVVYMAANFHAIWGTMIPASVILGLGSSPLWTAKCTYMTHLSVMYAKLTNTTKESVLSVFFGVFFMCFQSSQIWGNLISSLIFKHVEGNATSEEALSRCGATYCPSDYINNTNLERPKMSKIYTLCGVYLAFACLSAIVVIVFLDNLRPDLTSQRSNKTLVTAIMRHFYNSRYQKLLIPLTIYSGVEQAFVAGEFTRSFVSCAVGVWSVGFVMIAYGATDATFSLIVGRMVKLTGFIPWFALLFVVHGATQVTLLLWRPSADVMFVFYLLAVLWGMGDAVMQTLLNAYYGHILRANQSRLSPATVFASQLGLLSPSAGATFSVPTSRYGSVWFYSYWEWDCLVSQRPCSEEMRGISVQGTKSTLPTVVNRLRWPSSNSLMDLGKVCTKLS